MESWFWRLSISCLFCISFWKGLGGRTEAKKILAIFFTFSDSGLLRAILELEEGFWHRILGWEIVGLGVDFSSYCGVENLCGFGSFPVGSGWCKLRVNFARGWDSSITRTLLLWNWVDFRFSELGSQSHGLRNYSVPTQWQFFSIEINMFFKGFYHFRPYPKMCFKKLNTTARDK